MTYLITYIDGTQEEIEAKSFQENIYWGSGSSVHKGTIDFLDSNKTVVLTISIKNFKSIRRIS